MNNTFHIITSWSSSLIILIMGGLLLAVGIPSRAQWKHLRYGCFCLSASYLILGMASLVESIMELSGKLISMKSQLVLSVSFFQALLFTGSSLVLIRPQLLTMKAISTQLILIILLLIVFGSSSFLWPVANPIFLTVLMVVYVAQLLYYTFIFHKAYQEALLQEGKLKSEGIVDRFHSVKLLFYASLAIGVMALAYTLTPSSSMMAELFTIAYTTYYVALVFFFVYYSRRKNFALDVSAQPSITDSSHKGLDTFSIPVTDVAASSENIQMENIQVSLDGIPEKTETRAEKRLTEALDQWVKNERYLCPDVPLEEVANELNTDVDSLHDYFLSHKGVLFRTWRVMLRIEKAKQLLEMNPKIKISELQTQVGFSDKSYFFRRFKQVTGKTPNEYRNDL